MTEPDLERLPPPSSRASYSAGVRADKLFFTSGLVARDPETGAVVGEAADEQLTAIFANLERLLAEVGSTVADVIALTIYVDRMAHWQDVDRVFCSVFGSEPPARTVVGADLNEGIHVEVQAVSIARR